MNIDDWRFVRLQQRGAVDGFYWEWLRRIPQDQGWAEQLLPGARLLHRPHHRQEEDVSGREAPRLGQDEERLLRQDLHPGGRVDGGDFSDNLLIDLNLKPKSWSYATILI